MRLGDLPDYLRLRKDVDDPQLKKRLDDLYVDQLGHTQSEERSMRKFFFYAAICIYLLVTLATATVTLLGTAKVIDLEEKYLAWLWPAFVGEFVPLVIWLVRRLFRGS